MPSESTHCVSSDEAVYPVPNLWAARHLDNLAEGQVQKTAAFVYLSKGRARQSAERPRVLFGLLAPTVTNSKMFLGVLPWVSVVGVKYKTEVIVLNCVKKVPLPNPGTD